MARRSLSIELLGEERLIEQLLGISVNAEQIGRRTLKRSVSRVRNRAIDGINNGPKTGAVYTTYFATSPHGGVYAWGSRPPHQASARGEYPAADTGNLARTIWEDVYGGLAELDESSMSSQLSLGLDDIEDAASELVGEVGADALYAAPLEYKPPERGGRPFLRRALMESADDIIDDFITDLRGKLV